MRSSTMAFLALMAVACFGSDRSSSSDDDDDDWGGGLGGNGSGSGDSGGDDGGDEGGGDGDEGGGSSGTDPVDADGDGAFSDEDCDDGDPLVHPDAQEICDSDDVDEDCDALADDADDSVDPSTMYTYWRDQDGDGYGDSAVAVQACDAPPGFVGNDGDCDDTNGALNPDNPCGGDWEGEYSGELVIYYELVGFSEECDGEIWLEVDDDGRVVGVIDCVVTDSIVGFEELSFEVDGMMDSSGSIEGTMYMTVMEYEIGPYSWEGVGLTGPTRIEGTMDDTAVLDSGGWGDEYEVTVWSEFTATM